MGQVESHREAIRVLLVDDHTFYRRGLRTVLDVEDDIEVVGEAADGVAAVTQAEATMPDVIVMDVGMPKRGGIDACRVIRRRVPSARILMLTSSDDEADLFDALRAGANGYLLKSVTDEIADGIRGIFDGQAQLSPAMASKLIGEFARLSERSSSSNDALGVELSRLTERELEVLDLVARGRTNSEIADELVISINTVRNHIRNILDKLQMHSRLEAAMYAVRQRLIDPRE